MMHKSMSSSIWAAKTVRDAEGIRGVCKGRFAPFPYNGCQGISFLVWAVRMDVL